ncbi:hydrolase [Aureococcus anophagefferens]|nr:hydrolase [Aureococcus anophagefferens]
MAPWPTCETGPLEASDADCFALSSARVVLPCDAECLFEVVPATVVVVRGVIAAVFRPGDAVALPRAASSRRRARGVVAVPAAGPGTREDAQSPLMLLPFCQVDDSDDGGGRAAADAAPPPDDDDWAAPRGPAAATLQAGAAKDRSPDTPATPGGWAAVAAAARGRRAPRRCRGEPAESHCSTPTRRAAPPSEFFRSPKSESEAVEPDDLGDVRVGDDVRAGQRPGARSPRAAASLLDQVLGFMPRSSSFFGDAFGETSSPPKAPAEPPTPQSPGAAAWRRPRFAAGERRSARVAADPAELLGNLVAEHGRTATPVLEPDASLRPAPGGRSPPQVAAPPPPPPDGRRMSFLDLDARRASPPEAPLRKPNPRRPPAIKIFKENDRHTRRAIRKEYSLYCDGHPSAAGAIGLEAALDAAASLDDGGGASACGLSLHVAKVSTLQTARVLHDAQAHEDACAAAGTRRLFGDLSGSVALYHLTHCEEAVPHGATVHKVSPPIRHEAHRRALWSALQNGTVAVVTSGHAPGDPRGKLRESGDFLRAAHGTLAGANELLLPVLWSAARTNGYGLGALAVWLSFGPAKLLNLASDRGLIDVGFRADFVIFDADRDWTVDASKLQGVDGDVLDGIPEKKREKRLAAACLFHGHECSGKVLATLLRGRLTYREGRFRTAPHGEVVAR